MLSILTPWIEENDKHRIIFHHVPDCEDYVFKPHHAVHKLATSTKIECGLSASRTIAFSRKQITDDVMSDWANQFRLSQYVGQHFRYPRWSVRRRNHTGASCKPPSHLNGGTWLKDVGHSSSLTAQMVRGLTSHAPIGHYRHRLNIGDKIEACPHCEGGPPETFQHVLYRCLKHPTRPPDAPRFSEMSPLWDDFGKFIMDNPTAFAFKDSPIYSQTVDDSTRKVACWAKVAPASTRTRKAKSRVRPSGGRALPPRTVPTSYTLHESGLYGRISHRSAALTTAHVNVYVFHKATNPRARGDNSRKTGLMFVPIRDS